MWIIVVVFGSLLGIATAIFLTNKKQKNKSIAKEKENIHINYLEGISIRNGDFSGLKDMPFELIIKNWQKIVYDLRFLVKVYPEKLINLIHLETTEDKKNYLKDLVAEEFNSFPSFTADTFFSIYKQQIPIEDRLSIIAYVIDLIQAEEKNTVINILNYKIKELEGKPCEAIKSYLE